MVGASRSLFWVADRHGRFVAKAYFEALSDREKAGFIALFRRLADEDVRGHERLASEGDALLSLVSYRHRLVFYVSAGDLMIASGYSEVDQHQRAGALSVAQEIVDLHRPIPNVRPV